jgi:hypothetical protein
MEDEGGGELLELRQSLWQAKGLHGFSPAGVQSTVSVKD